MSLHGNKMNAHSLKYNFSSSGMRKKKSNDMTELYYCHIQSDTHGCRVGECINFFVCIDRLETE